MKRILLLILAAAVVLGAGADAWAKATLTANGGKVYLPIYRNLIIDERGRRLPVHTNVYVRNLDQKQNLRLISATLFDAQGRQVGSLASKEIVLTPLAAVSFSVKPFEDDGGEACVIINWSAKAPVRPPMVQGLILGTAGQQGISLTTRGVNLDLD